MTSVPPPSFGPRGFVAPAQSAIVAGVFADINAAFGGGLNPDPTTPQGQLAISIGAVIGFCNDALLAVINQVDPAYSFGRMQDAIARIYYLARRPAVSTVVQVNCTGAVGTIIPAGSLAKAADGQTYAATVSATIPIGGTVPMTFAALNTGAIACPAGSLTTIYRAIPGWDTITNPTDGVLGQIVESTADFEARRAASVALNAVGILPALRANVLAVPNVIDAYVTENPTAAAATIGGVSIAARALFVSVAGGLPADIGKAIWRKKPPGCGYTGTTTVTVTDDNSGYANPKPTYSVTFTVATPTPIKFAVSIATGPAVPADAIAQVRAAIVLAFAGADGGPRAKIGSTIYSSRFYAVVAALGIWAQIVSIKVGTTTATLDNVTVNIDQAPTLNPTDIAVTLV